MHHRETPYHLFLKGLRRILSVNKKEPYSYSRRPGLPSVEEASRCIYDGLQNDKPVMIARLGSTELAAMVNYHGISSDQRCKAWQYIRGKYPQYWWNKKILEQMQTYSGFFPPSSDMVEKFCQMMIKDMEEIDILGSWLPEEKVFTQLLADKVQVHLFHLEPFWASFSWTEALAGKRVLVIHPFAKSIIMQYDKRDLLFPGRNILPDFELKVIPAVQSLGGNGDGFQDWFAALDSMKRQIDATKYDICLIGCGAYGFPLAAHVKRSGKKAVHLGGSLQLLFGIKGKRWSVPGHGSALGLDYPALFNENWIKPLPEDNRLSNDTMEKVENSCYW